MSRAAYYSLASVSFLLCVLCVVAAVNAQTEQTIKTVEPLPIEAAGYLYNLVDGWNIKAEKAGIPFNKDNELQEVLAISQLIYDKNKNMQPAGVSEFHKVYTSLITGHLRWWNLQEVGITKNEIEYVKKAYRLLPPVQEYVSKNTKP